MKKYIIMMMAATMGLTSCDDLFEPANENVKDLDMMYDEPSFAQSFVIVGYSRLPGYYSDLEYATDDAVTNEKGNWISNMATGSWSASSNPTDYWPTGFAAIQYLNTYIANGDKINYVNNEAVNQLMRMRTMGEAYGLRAAHYYYLLRQHAGFSEDGELLGVQLFTEAQGADADFNQPRASFAECIKRIESDLKKAEELLPNEYYDIADASEIPAQFRSVTDDKDLYNRAMGHTSRLLFNGTIAKAFRARVNLLAASPAFQDASNSVTWADAADAAASVIDLLGGIGGLSSDGVAYYCDKNIIDNLKEGLLPQEMVWRNNISSASNSLESNNYPPTLFGKGRLNPTQNLVESFPMANGYPITDSRSGFDKSNPFAGRDPRLATYIIYDGQPCGPNDDLIHTGSASGTNDGINAMENSTRTGYYMKKRLRMDVNCNPATPNNQIHYDPRIRATEMFLSYAEAANEAWGPKNGGSHAYSAYDVIKAIRHRAGITDDAYLDECAGSKEKMRELIHNERRLELCFENFRFWDVRRWKEKLDVAARGYDASTGEVFNVENRNYKDYMIYCPIPYSEILKYSNLKQNKGWK
ncbi:MAG: RagB/SusD family nutrient uptake outer membrane protein [Prevotella sp.]|nr:RagB/SusD family nutrient uptake outer membrane protein [Prevotella sp.]MBO5156996.1 RagB/SusD family nutrient uptake outer membrane protein [Prevotella sp.]